MTEQLSYVCPETAGDALLGAIREYDQAFVMESVQQPRGIEEHIDHHALIALLGRFAASLPSAPAPLDFVKTQEAVAMLWAGVQMPPTGDTPTILAALMRKTKIARTFYRVSTELAAAAYNPEFADEVSVYLSRGTNSAS